MNVNEAQLMRLVRGPNGPMAKALSRAAIKVEGAAKLNASGRPGPKVQSGRLRSSISWTLKQDGRGLYAIVGTNVYYAKWIEFGSERAPAYPFLRPALRVLTG